MFFSAGSAQNRAMCADCFDMLREFHCKIHDALIPFAQAIDTLESTGKWTPELYPMIRNFKAFHEEDVAAHIRDEEIAFYPILHQRWCENHPLETIHSPTEYMLQEHTDIAAHIYTIGVLADLLRQQPANTMAIENLVGEGRAVLTILPMHMQKEEQFLFPQARKLLPADDIVLATRLIQKLRQK